MKTSHIRPPSALGGLLAGRLKLALRVLRDGWLILGMIAALLLILEVGYRLQGAVRPGARPALAGIPAGSPLASVEWGAAYVAEHDSTFALRWEPYVYFRRLPYAGRFITVDSLGRRLTPQRLETPVGGQVLFLGGSTMWGSYLRDEHTIPALVARHLDSLPTGPAIEVLNLAEAGYVFTQEVIALSMALRDGLRPDVVVFYDGINDVASMVQQGRAGIPQNAFNRAAEFAWGRDLNPPLPSARADLKAMARLTVAAANLSDLVRRVRGGRPSCTTTSWRRTARRGRPQQPVSVPRTGTPDHRAAARFRHGGRCSGPFHQPERSAARLPGAGIRRCYRTQHGGGHSDDRRRNASRHPGVVAGAVTGRLQRPRAV